MGQTCFGQDQAPPVLLLICWGMEGVIRAKLHKNRAFPEDPVPRHSEDVEVVVIGGGESRVAFSKSAEPAGADFRGPHLKDELAVCYLRPPAERQFPCSYEPSHGGPSRLFVKRCCFPL